VIRSISRSCKAVLTSIAFAAPLTSLASEVGSPADAAVLHVAATAAVSPYKVLHSFAGGRDGATPEAGLEYANGLLWGTTFYGGGFGKSPNTFGTVFAMDAGGAVKIVHAFQDVAADGYTYHPESPLTYVDGAFYGTTSLGGLHDYGTVYKVTSAGQVDVLHAFDRADGSYPESGLVYVDNAFYGTTSGLPGNVFKVTTAGKESVLHTFGKGTDGANVFAGLTYVGGTFFGTTPFGGTKSEGTVFSVSPTGAERVLLDLTGLDGIEPGSGLTDIDGVLYGTTQHGGTNGGGGAVFSVTQAGKVRVIHSFGTLGGYYPVSRMIYEKGFFYGTTDFGGAFGKGTLYSVTLAGGHFVLHSFGGPGDGYGPSGNLLNVNGVLYGTTQFGGAHGDGTVFSYTL